MSTETDDCDGLIDLATPVGLVSSFSSFFPRRLMSQRYRSLPLAAPRSNTAHELREGLTASPKCLPCTWFYDDAGSQLF
jgi:hypothetical protein